MLTVEFEKLRISHKDGQHFDDQVIQSIESFLPYRNEVIEILVLLSRNTNSDETVRVVHRFLESLIPYMERPRDVHGWRDQDFDNFKFIAHEIFLYSLASFIRNERFDTAAALMEMKYYCPTVSQNYNMDMLSFWIFSQPLSSFEDRNRRLDMRRLSLRADLLKQRSSESGVEFRDLIQADFILCLRDYSDRPNDFGLWWPDTLTCAFREVRAFEIFARSQLAKYFDRVMTLLNIDDKEALRTLVGRIKSNMSQISPLWQLQLIEWNRLIGYEGIATQP